MRRVLLSPYSVSPAFAPVYHKARRHQRKKLDLSDDEFRVTSIKETIAQGTKSDPIHPISSRLATAPLKVARLPIPLPVPSSLPVQSTYSMPFAHSAANLSSFSVLVDSLAVRSSLPGLILPGRNPHRIANRRLIVNVKKKKKRKMVTKLHHESPLPNNVLS